MEDCQTDSEEGNITSDGGELHWCLKLWFEGESTIVLLLRA